MIDRLIPFQVDIKIESCCCNKWFLDYSNSSSLYLCWGRGLSVPLLIKYRHPFQKSWKVGCEIDSRLHLGRANFPFFGSRSSYTFLSNSTIYFFLIYFFFKEVNQLCKPTCRLGSNARYADPEVTQYSRSFLVLNLSVALSLLWHTHFS